jgi:hypothetical protein
MIQLFNGDVLRCTVRFEHLGAARAGIGLRVAICQHGATYDELPQHFIQRNDVSVDDDLEWTTYTEVVDIPIHDIPNLVGPGLYELYAKMTGIPGADLYWYGPDDDLEFVAEEFENLLVTYTKV